MADDLTCSECGTTVESTDDVETETVPVVDTDESDGSVNLYGDRDDLFLCTDCGKPMVVGRNSD